MLLQKILQKILSYKIKNNFLAKIIGEKELEIIFSDLSLEFLKLDINLEVIKRLLGEIKDEIRLEKKIFMGKDEVQLEIYSKIREKLIASLGSHEKEFQLRKKVTNKILLVGVNGSGKTTTAGKLIYYLKNKRNMNRIEAVSLDRFRAAAFEQLRDLISPLNIMPLFAPSIEGKGGLREIEQLIKSKLCEVVIYDSEGTIPNSPSSLEYLREVKEIIRPTETILVLDALSGQESLELVKSFHSMVNLDSIIVSKSDSLSPLGAALSAHYFFKLPIKFLGEGERLEDLVPFYPERIISQILEEGDFKTLSEKFSEISSDSSPMEQTIMKLLKGKFDLNDLISQLKELRKVGSFSGLTKFFPNLGKLTDRLNSKTGELEEEFKVWEVLINSMTDYERKNPKILRTESSRRARIIKGAGRKPEELNRLLSKWEASLKKIEEMGQKLITKKGNLWDLFSSFK